MKELTSSEKILVSQLPDMSLDSLGRVVRDHWPKVYFGAVPYLDAMCELHSIEDNYGLDTGKSIVIYFLCNAQTWRGPVAKEVKAELKKRAGIK